MKFDEKEHNLEDQQMQKKYNIYKLSERAEKDLRDMEEKGEFILVKDFDTFFDQFRK